MLTGSLHSINLNPEMIAVTFVYSEIMDVDWTAVDISIESDRVVLARYRNYELTEFKAETIYSNQSETFYMPDLQSARDMVQSCDFYTEVPL